jgi:hypothetical protein
VTAPDRAVESAVAMAGGALPDGRRSDPPAAVVSAPRLILGFTLRDLALVVAFLSLTLWAIWATAALIELQKHRIVSVSLSTIIKDFVAVESRTAASPEIAAARTKAYLTATDAALQSLAQDGTTVTKAVSAAVNAWLAKAPLQGSAPAEAAAAATSPASTSPAPVAGGGSAESTSPFGASPFGSSAQSGSNSPPEAGDGF